jgi:serine/threonine protein kinase
MINLNTKEIKVIDFGMTRKNREHETYPSDEVMHLGILLYQLLVNKTRLHIKPSRRHLREDIIDEVRRDSSISKSASQLIISMLDRNQSKRPTLLAVRQSKFLKEPEPVK